MKTELSNGLEVKAVMWLNIMVAEYKSGVPDLLVCANGRFIGIEIKAEHGKLAPLQRSHLDKILTSGGAVAVIRPSELDGFKKFIEEVLRDD